MSPEQLAYYEKLHSLVSRMRTAHWEAKKYRSRSAADKEYRLGLEIDKLVRSENLKRKKLSNEQDKQFNQTSN
jgi:hypothetical protein